MRLGIFLMGALALAACKKDDKPAVGTGAVPPAGAPAPLPPLGSADPWGKPSPEAKKAFADYQKLSRAKKNDEARKAIDRAVELAPELEPYREAQVGLAIRSGDFRGV